MIDTMTVEKMKTYKGRQNKPENFDLFWENEISQLPVELKFKLEEKKYNIPNVKFYELEFQSTKNSTIYSILVVPHSNEPVPVIFQFHGYQGQSPDWSTHLNYAHAGFAMVSMDVRGQAGKSIDGGKYQGNTVKGHVVRGMTEGPENLFYKEVYLDVYQLVRIVREFDFIDEANMNSYGLSQGGALSLITAALIPEIRKTVAIYPFLSDFKRVLEFGNQSEAYDELFRYFKFNDPMHRQEDEILKTISYIDVKNFANKIRSDVLMITGLEDNICFPSTQFAVFNQINSNKRHLVLPEYSHEDMNVIIKDLIFDFLTGSSFVS